MICKFSEKRNNEIYCSARCMPCYCVDRSDREIRKCEKIYSLSGFLSPSGKYSFCPYFYHMDLAIDLVKKDFGIKLNKVEAEKFLLKNGYIGFYHYTATFLNPGSLTDPQIKYMEGALTYCTVEEKYKAIKEILEKDALQKREVK